MYIEKLKLNNYKNHQATQLKLDERVNIFVGNNGMGKTNLLDGLYMVCYGRSYFSTKEIHIKNYDAGYYRLEAKVYKQGSHEKAVVKHDGKQKLIEVDDVAIESMVEYLGRYPVIMISPGDIELVYGGSEVRRRFLDQILSQVDKTYLKHLMAYNRVLKQRNAFLKQMGDRAKQNAHLVEAWNTQMGTHGAAVFNVRHKFLEELELLFKRKYDLLGGQQDDVALSYKSQLLSDDFHEGLSKHWEKDVVLRRSNFGVHRDDILLQKDSMLLRKVGSQGQIKTAVLALKLAQIEHIRATFGYLPIVLLDDIFDKLDPLRIKNLIKELVCEQQGQIFITDAFKLRLVDLLHDINLPSYKVWVIQDGEAELLEA